MNVDPYAFGFAALRGEPYTSSKAVEIQPEHKLVIDSKTLQPIKVPHIVAEIDRLFRAPPASHFPETPPDKTHNGVKLTEEYLGLHEVRISSSGFQYKPQHPKTDDIAENIPHAMTYKSFSLNRFTPEKAINSIIFRVGTHNVSCIEDITNAVRQHLVMSPEAFVLGIPVALSCNFYPTIKAETHRLICTSPKWTEEARKGRGKAAIHRLKLLDKYVTQHSAYFGSSPDTPRWDERAYEVFSGRFEEFKKAAASVPLDVENYDAMARDLRHLPVTKFT